MQRTALYNSRKTETQLNTKKQFHSERRNALKMPGKDVFKQQQQKVTSTNRKK